MSDMVVGYDIISHKTIKGLVYRVARMIENNELKHLKEDGLRWEPVGGFVSDINREYSQTMVLRKEAR